MNPSWFCSRAEIQNQLRCPTEKWIKKYGLYRNRILCRSCRMELGLFQKIAITGNNHIKRTQAISESRDHCFLSSVDPRPDRSIRSYVF